MIIVGHRGAPNHAPENTLRSFKVALEQGAQMIELDIYRCATGELVVIHDNRLDRTTNGTGFVVDKGLDELQQLDAGEGEIIPTLTEVLNFISARVPVNIELKGPGTAEALSEFLTDYIPNSSWENDDFLVSSFDLPQLKQFHQLKPEIRHGALNGGIPLDLGGFAAPIDPWSIHYSLEFVTKEMVDDAHRRGKKVFVYTIKCVEDKEIMQSWGVDGIFANSPEKMFQ